MNDEILPLAPTAVNLVGEIGAIVRNQRKRVAKMTQAEAAALCNIGIRFLSDLENGKPTIQMGMALKVLRAFGIQVVLKKKTL
jgi:HTH-type transcriptional regulator / antitoxin HipB